MIVCPLVFLGGFVDAIAGGGGLITLPGYLLAGVPPHVALATNKLSGALGTGISTFRLYRGGYIDLKLALVPVMVAFFGSMLGARLALMVPATVFQMILIVCLPIAALFVMRKQTISSIGQAMDISKRRLILGLCAFACGTYDGFYGPGAGTFMLIGFSVLGQLGIRDAAGQMKIVNFASGMAALAMFAYAGKVDWMLGLIAGVFSVTGHWIGAGMVMQNGTRIVRPIILGVIALLFVKTAWNYWM